MTETYSIERKVTAEAVGSFFLFAAVIGSGIMAENLAGDNIALALLANSVATGAILYVLIAMLSSISGAHFNPAVSLSFWIRREMSATTAALFIAAQLAGGILGAVACHVMFDLPLLQFSIKARAGIGQWVGEFVATFGLVLTILLLLRFRATAIPAGVGLYITSAYWFTSSTSFANPAITIVRSFSNTFAGIAPNDVLLFVMAQILGALLAVGLVEWLTKPVAIK